MWAFRAGVMLLVLGTLAIACGAEAPPAIPDFTFVHCSDIHVPAGVTMRTAQKDGVKWGSAEVVAQIRTLTAPMTLTPYHVTVPTPSFAIATGDLTEFGGGNGWWEEYQALWKGVPFPVYYQVGNHDNTWACQRYRLRELYGSAYYSFDRNGCHFIGLDSATPQDPRPSFGEEEIRWLREDLRRVRPDTPIFVYCHHPIDGNEFASPYERDRLLDTLRPYNLALILVGHGHAVEHRVICGVDQVMGGSTFGKAPGYAVVSVKDGILRVAYRTAAEETAARPMLERPLKRKPDYPRIDLQPRWSEETGVLRVSAQVHRNGITTARWELDDEKGRAGELTRSGESWKAEIPTNGLAAGVHYVRVTFTGAGGASFQRTERFETKSSAVRVLWRAFLGGSGKGSPCAEGDLLVTGGGDGVLYGLDRRTGKTRWTVRTGGEILAKPLAWSGQFLVGSGDGKLYSVDRRGKVVWTFDAGAPIYSTAATVNDKLIVAAISGHVFGVRADGKRAWGSTLPGYSIEAPLLAVNGAVDFGCWDGNFYSLNGEDGSLHWKTMGTGSATYPPGLVRYYSPADAPPVLSHGGGLWLADRAFHVARYAAESGKVLSDQKGVSSVGASADGSTVYLRGTDGNLRKVSADGTPIWSVAAGTSNVPSVPVERGGVVYSTTSTGLLKALDAADGHLRWEYQLTPRLYVFSEPAVVEGTVYATGMDGSVTALRAAGTP